MIRGIKGIDILKLVTDLSRGSRGRTGDSVDFGFTKIRNTAGKTVRRKLFRVGDAEPGFSVAYSLRSWARITFPVCVVFSHNSLTVHCAHSLNPHRQARSHGKCAPDPMPSLEIERQSVSKF